MTSKALKRSRRRNRLISLPGGEAVNQPPSGRDRMDALQPIAGTHVGMCIVNMAAAHERPAGGTE